MKKPKQPADSWSRHGRSESLIEYLIFSLYRCCWAMKQGRARATGAPSSAPSPPVAPQGQPWAVVGIAPGSSLQNILWFYPQIILPYSLITLL